MVEIQQKNIPILIQLTVVVLGFLFLLGDIFPRLQDISRYQEKIRSMKAAAKMVTKEDKIALQKKLQQELDSLDQEYKKLQGVQQQAQAKLTKGNNVPMITLMVEDLAASNHIELRFIKPLPTEERGAYELLPVALEFSCEYAQMVNFISQLKSLTLPVSVQNLTISENALTAPKQEVKLTIFVLFTST